MLTPPPLSSPHRGLSVLTFHRAVFAPLHLRGADWNARSRYLHAVRSFDRFREGTAIVADLTAETIAAWSRWTMRHGGTAGCAAEARRRRETLRKIADVAAAFGLIAPLPPELPVPPETVLLRGADHGATLRGFLEETYIPLRLRGAAKKSRDTYRRAVGRLEDYCGCEVLLCQLTDDLLERFLAWALRSGRAPATANLYRCHLLALWRYAWRKRRVDELPRDVEEVPEPKRVPEAWTQAELERLLSVCRALPGTMRGVPASVWWTALVLTIYDTGLRIGAVMRLRSDALDRASGWLTVPPEIQKHRAGQVFRVHPDTLALLRQFPPSDGALFAWPYRGRHGGDDIWVHFGRILRAAGLPAGPRDKFHKLRRCHATYLTDACGEDEAQKSLGHSSPHITRMYIDPRLLTRRIVAADVLPRPGAGGTP